MPLHSDLTNGRSRQELTFGPCSTSSDTWYMARPDVDEIQLDLFGDYASNVALYPTFQAYFREHRPPLLAIWGKNDPFFLPAGAEAYRRDLPDAQVRCSTPATSHVKPMQARSRRRSGHLCRTDPAGGSRKAAASFSDP